MVRERVVQLESVNEIENLRKRLELSQSAAFQAAVENTSGPIRKIVDELNKSQAQKLAEEFATSPLIKSLNDIKISGLQSYLNEIRTPLVKLTSAFEASAAVSSIHAIRYSSEFSGLAEAARRLAQQTGPMSLREALSVNHLAHLASKDAEQYVSAVLTEAEEKSNAAPISILSIEFYLSLIFAIMLFLASQDSAVQSEARILGRIDAMHQQLSTQLEE